VVRPITAIYSSTSRRAIDTVAPLANRLRIGIATDEDLRERELPPVSDFEAAVRESWQSFDAAPRGGESNRAAQSRGVFVVRRILDRHAGEEVVVATHGTLLTLILNDFDAAVGHEFWQRLSFPDIVRATFAGERLVDAERIWNTASQ
jgi:2,3-bisphosphoglycerate-dependent phosphoglycerate mutase